jgi:hypothetical protein
MKDEAPMHKHPLQEAIESSNNWTCRSYSGRGMYGKTCLGVETDSYQLGELFSDIIQLMDEDDRDEICKAISSMREDGMGLGLIVYFPSVPFIEEDEEEDDNQEEI